MTFLRKKTFIYIYLQTFHACPCWEKVLQNVSKMLRLICYYSAQFRANINTEKLLKDNKHYTKK